MLVTRVCRATSHASDSRARVTRPSHAPESRARVTRPSHAPESRAPPRVQCNESMWAATVPMHVPRTPPYVNLSIAKVATPVPGPCTGQIMDRFPLKPRVKPLVKPLVKSLVKPTIPIRPSLVHALVTSLAKSWINF